MFLCPIMKNNQVILLLAYFLGLIVQLNRNIQEIDAIDSMIAAIALLENEPLLTRNTKHFTRIKGLRVESY